MGILEEVRVQAKELARGLSVKAVAVGLYYAAVLLDNSSLGLAYVLKEGLHLERTLEDYNALVGQSAANAIDLLPSLHPVEAALGLAAVNAVANAREFEVAGFDVLDVVDVKKDDVVCVVGYIRPTVEKLRELTSKLYVIESYPCPDAYPWWCAFSLLPKASVVLITASSIVNKSIGCLLKLSKKARLKVLVGASTPMLPEVFGKYGVDYLAGVKVEDPNEALRLVAAGASRRQLNNVARKIVVSTRSF